MKREVATRLDASAKEKLAIIELIDVVKAAVADANACSTAVVAATVR